MNKKSFVKGKYLEPLIGAGAGSLIIAASPGVENTKGNLAASAAVGGIGMSALGRLAAKQGADIQRIDRIPRNYFFKGTGRNYVSEGNTTAEKIRNARQAATTAAEQEDNSIFSHLHVKADFTDSVRPLYEKKLNPRIKDVQDTLFGLDFRKKFTKNLNKAQAPLDAESR